MTPAEIRQAIKDDPELRAWADEGRDNVIADKLSSSLPVSVELAPETRIGEQGVFAALGLEDGERFLQAVEGIAAITDDQNPLFPMASTMRRVCRWLQASPWLDVGSAMVQEQVRFLASIQSIDESVADKLCALGTRTIVETIHDGQVAEALRPFREGGICTPIDWNKV